MWYILKPTRLIIRIIIGPFIDFVYEYEKYCTDLDHLSYEINGM